MAGLVHAFHKDQTMPMILNEEQNMLKDTAKEFCTEKSADQ